jgi:hypothetical protein
VGAAGRVISFKSSICDFPVLQQNIALNGFNNVFAFPIALTKESGKQLLFAAGRGATLCSVQVVTSSRQRCRNLPGNEREARTPGGAESH